MTVMPAVNGANCALDNKMYIYLKFTSKSYDCAARPRLPDVVFIRTNEHFGMSCGVKIFHRSAAKPQ